MKWTRNLVINAECWWERVVAGGYSEMVYTIRWLERVVGGGNCG